MSLGWFHVMIVCKVTVDFNIEIQDRLIIFNKGGLKKIVYLTLNNPSMPHYSFLKNDISIYRSKKVNHHNITGYSKLNHSLTIQMWC